MNNGHHFEYLWNGYDRGTNSPAKPIEIMVILPPPGNVTARNRLKSRISTQNRTLEVRGSSPRSSTWNYKGLCFSDTALCTSGPARVPPGQDFGPDRNSSCPPAAEPSRGPPACHFSSCPFLYNPGTEPVGTDLREFQCPTESVSVISHPAPAAETRTAGRSGKDGIHWILVLDALLEVRPENVRSINLQTWFAKHPSEEPPCSHLGNTLH